MPLSQLSLFFGVGVKKVLPTQKFSLHKNHDPKLEALARERLRLLAPELSTLIVVGWNSRMRTTAGVAIAAKWEIWLNPAIREISEHEVERTLLHELAHLLAQFRHGRRRLQPHGEEWRDACRDLGIAGESRTHQMPLKVRRMKKQYRLHCPVCGQSHDRVRAPKRRVACLSCCSKYHGGKYHERFRLEIENIE